MTEPTDAEIVALLGDRQFSSIGAVREALRRWGTPPAVAPWRSVVLDLIDDCPGLTMEQDQWLSRRVKELDFASTPQPTQAQAGAVPQYRLLHSGVDRIEDDDEFLSDDTTTWAIDPNGIFSGNIYGGHVLRPARRRIKGGQHGPS